MSSQGPTPILERLNDNFNEGPFPGALYLCNWLNITHGSMSSSTADFGSQLLRRAIKNGADRPNSAQKATNPKKK